MVITTTRDQRKVRICSGIVTVNRPSIDVRMSDRKVQWTFKRVWRAREARRCFKQREEGGGETTVWGMMERALSAYRCDRARSSNQSEQLVPASRQTPDKLLRACAGTVQSFYRLRRLATKMRPANRLNLMVRRASIALGKRGSRCAAGAFASVDDNLCCTSP